MNIEEVRELIQIINIMKECANKDEYFEITDEDVKVLYDYITELQEENRTLKEFNVCVGCNNNPDYETRINKAIEYINKTTNNTMFELRSDTGELNYLMRILKGDE